MITVGFVREIEFISNSFKTPIFIKLVTEKNSGVLDIAFKNGYLELFYKQKKIWKEKVSFDESMFGVESCDTIFRIIRSIDLNEENWEDLCFFEK
jgi:hypothetical protein